MIPHPPSSLIRKLRECRRRDATYHDPTCMTPEFVLASPVTRLLVFSTANSSLRFLLLQSIDHRSSSHTVTLPTNALSLYDGDSRQAHKVKIGAEGDLGKA